MTVDRELYRRAGGLCATAGPHRDADEDWPCTRHLLQAARSIHAASAVASTRSSVASRVHVGRVDGAAGRALVPPSSPAGGSTLHKSNRLGTRNPEAAEGATAIARNESMP